MSPSKIHIELVPTLDHCVETLAKQEYKAALEKLLASAERSTKLQCRIELLRLFLETTDFKRLRSEYEPRLIEGRTVKFVLYQEENSPQYKIIVE